MNPETRRTTRHGRSDTETMPLVAWMLNIRHVVVQHDERDLLRAAVDVVLEPRIPERLDVVSLKTAGEHAEADGLLASIGPKPVS